MSTRTVIEINHDNLDDAAHWLQVLVSELKGTSITGALNKMGPFQYGVIRVLAQRHHTEDLKLFIGDRGYVDAS